MKRRLGFLDRGLANLTRNALAGGAVLLTMLGTGAHATTGGTSRQSAPKEISVRRAANIGGVLGFTSLSNNFGTGAGFGLQGSYYPQESYGLGGYIRSGNHDLGVSSFQFGVEGIYRWNNWAPGLQTALSVGGSKFSLNGQSGDTAFAFGGRAGYDYVFPGSPVTLGFDALLQFTKPGTKMLTLFMPTASVKYWF